MDAVQAQTPEWSPQMPTTPDLEQLRLQPAGKRDGMRVFAARDCRLPCQDVLHATLQPMPATEPAAERATEGDTEPTAEPATERAAAAGMELLQATASSTGVDHHGTEMTLEALRGMAEQMKAGVVYTPSHRSAEWDDVMGRTVDAEVVEGRVLHGGASGREEGGYHLRATVALYPDHEKGRQLLRAMGRPGTPIGTSIGGWFTDVEFMVDDNDEVQRVLIKAVELDHLATTRRPSNRESWIEGLRARAQASLPQQSAPAASAADSGQPTDERHLLSVVENEDTVTVTYGKADGWQGMKPAPEPIDDEVDDEGVSDVPADADSLDGRAGSGDSDAQQPNDDPTASPAQAPHLDTCTPAGEDGHGPDADQRAVPTSMTPQPTEDGHMSEHEERGTEATEATDRMERLERSLEALTGLVGKMAERASAPAEPTITPEQRAAELELKVQALQGRLSRAMATAGRAGMGAITRERIHAAGGFAGMAQRSAGSLGDASALRIVAEGQAARRDAMGKDTPDRAQLESDLRSVLAAAFTDGIITDPSSNTSWEG